MLKEEGNLLTTLKYENIYYANVKTGERIITRTVPSWFMKVSEKLKMRCLQELASIKYVPKLNLKSTEQTH